MQGLLIIDMQNDFASPGGTCEVPGANATIPAIRAILQRFRELHWPVFHVVREYRPDASDVELFRKPAFLAKGGMVVPGKSGCRIVPGLEPLKDEYRIVKQRFSAFFQTELDLLLRRMRISELVVTGTQLPFCLRATLFDGISLDYTMSLVTDASSSRSPEIHAANIQDCRDAGVICLSVNELLTKL